MAETDANPISNEFMNSNIYGIEEQTPTNNLDEFSFRKILLNLDRNLMQHDIVGLKYICLDKCIGLRHGELEKVERGLDILDKLEKRGLLSKDKLDIIIEMLGLIDRIDLKIQVEKNVSFSQRGKQRNQISNYRRMALDFAYDIGQKELTSLKPLLKEQMTARKIENLDDPIKLMIELEKMAIISSTKLEFLYQVADYLDNDELTLKLRTYKEKRESGFQETSEEQSSYHETKSSAGYTLEKEIKSLKADDPQPRNVHVEGNQQDRCINYVAGKLGPEWRYLAYKLGLKSMDIDGVNDPHSMLLKWQQRTEPDTQIDTLCEALSSTKVRRGDISQYLKQDGFQSLQPTSDVKAEREDEISISDQSVAEMISVQSVSMQEQGLQIRKYKMIHLPRGICLIINNMQFTPESRLKERRGSNIDEDNLVSVFDYLGFDVRVTRNATAYKMKQVVDDASRMDHSNHDCFVCCILSHGDLGTVSSSDGQSCKILDFTNPFRPKYCPTLAAKPKLFFLQACQGSRRAEKFDHMESDASSATSDNIPDDADFLLGYATAPGNVSFRSRTLGSWYITMLTQALRDHHNTNHILDILTHVNSEVSKAIAKESKGTYKQVPAPQYTLRKNLFFTK